MDYTSFVAALAAKTELDTASDSDFGIYLPTLIDNVERRLYRDLDPVVARRSQYTTLIPGVPLLTGPPDWLVGRALYVTDRTTQMQSRVEQRDETFLAEYCPDYSEPGKPKYWAEHKFQIIQMAPAPDRAFEMRMIYTFRPDPISATNTTTWLTTNVPDLFFKAALIEADNYRQNWQAMQANAADYGTLIQPMRREEGRRKGEGYFDMSATPPPSNAIPTGR